MQPDIYKFLYRQIRARVMSARKTEGGTGLLELEAVLTLFSDQRYYAYRHVNEIANFWAVMRKHDEDNTPIDLVMDIANALYQYLGGNDDVWIDFLKSTARGINAGRTPQAKSKAEHQQADDDFTANVLKTHEWETIMLANPWMAIITLIQLAQFSVIDINEDIRLNRGV